ncbi:MAG: His/Gly/Thr/Pro-type tRNA ligase C-terminal domain-containing protein, partial [Anaerolineae bacterium]|nr:His/Gly/Thr/Pro-type tRNA ligase C-terminal domain-containing protein [Anaerolineae bacterium]
YGLGLGRLMSAVAEQSHDERGLIWPSSIAPYQIHLVSLGRAPQILEAAENAYAALSRSRLEVLYDDRDESPGVKFNDADLIGIPLRLTVGPRSLAAGGVEAKRRSLTEAEIVPIDSLSARVRELLDDRD